MSTRSLALVLSAFLSLLAARPLLAQSLPVCELAFLGPADTVTAMSETGLVTGQVTVGAASRAWVASASSAPVLLPIPPGDQFSWAHDINEQGVIVGAVGPDSKINDTGRAVAWWPDGSGGHVLQELGLMPGYPASQALALNNVGDIVGYASNSFYFRFAVWFTAPGGPMSLGALGIIDPKSVNDLRQVVDRSGTRFHLDTLVGEKFTPLPGCFGTFLTSINELGQFCGAAVLLPGTSCATLPVRYVDGAGYQVLGDCSPSLQATPTDINDLGDVVYEGALPHPILHLEGLGEFEVDALLAPSAAGWSVLPAKGVAINSARQVAVVVVNDVTGQSGAALLTPSPHVGQTDLGFGGPGLSQLFVSGGDLSTGTTADLTVIGLPPLGVGFLCASLAATPTPVKGGILVPVPTLLIQPIVAGPAGTEVVPSMPGGGGPLSIYVQCVHKAPALPGGYGFSNAVRIDLLP